MKKILAFTLVIILALSLCACARRTETETVEYKKLSGAVGTPDEVINSKTYEDTLEGLCKYMEDKNCIYHLPVSSADEKFSDPVVMSASVIGADKGYKFSFEYDGELIVTELYSYSDTSNKWYQQAVKDGKITISEDIDNGTFDVIVNGKYLMIYNDSDNRSARESQVVEIFKSFKIQ